MSSIHSILDQKDWNLNEIELILENDPFSVQEVNLSGLSPLHRVLKEGSIDTIKCLLHYGADPNYLDKGDIDNHPIFISLMQRKQIEIISVLLEAGANVHDIYDRNGHSPLCIALRYDPSTDLIKMLLEAGCSPKKRPGHISPLQCAMSNQGLFLRANICRLLLKKDKSFLVGNDGLGRSFLCHALNWNGQPEAIKVLLEAGCPLNACQEHYSALGCATDGRGILKIAIVQLLLDAGAKVGYVKKYCQNSDENILMHKVLENRNYGIDTIKLLYDCDNDCFPGGWPTSGLLHCALKNFLCKSEVLQFLIDQGANASEIINGFTPLHLAVQKVCSSDIFEVLLRNGCPANKVFGMHQYTVLKEALESRDSGVIEVLLKGGARLTAAGNVSEILQNALEKFDSRPCKEHFKRVKILLKYALLENPKFDMKVLVLGLKHYRLFSKFNRKCVKEIKILISMKIYQFVGRYSDYKPKAKRNQLLKVPSVNKFSVYFDVICATYGRKAMEMRIQVQPIYCRYNGSNSNTCKVILNYDIVQKIAGYLVDDKDLFSLLVALYNPDKPTYYAEGKKNNFKRSSEDLIKPCKR